MLAAEFMEMILARRELSALMLRLMGERLVSDAKRISHLIVIDALRRVAAEVIERATVVGAVVELPERVDLAARLGMTRQTLATQLSELQRRGLIRIAGNRIQVLDAQQLADLVQ
jgi:CRP-like cAMP-binding protein